MTREDYARYVRNLQSIIDAFEYSIEARNKDLIKHQEQLRKHKEELEEIKNKYRHYEEQRK
ncbi:hypothetical protein ERICIV_02205 [Paenibacillus larvae subsp. larvae]|uniref:Uncharacterized protein n=5 Tax=root TaxID=1 RepID=A0A345AVJ7_9CAUD|nr:hypothetical protein [Paenibacillus larvae]YP_010082320.1 hypothetical protein KMD18_gp66 [Paenibacillus phage Halcyone]YP_010082411.1 hypothetical protein KMD19_gp67 [Paenibacillus phage Scottie]YP_010082489.1 hypothetical protein KMD20_gp54 [Paenibacillus phage Unity]AXF41020.1 hypothetical protein HEATH_66 [Paenibacillus phage Heath]AQT83231.1 hypothetical protein B1222_00165 [Paenibacillus larvae subsp. pulvifaciens]AQZ48353.1 hypothetical protein B5S25_18945 [Paenibacillus larvae subs